MKQVILGPPTQHPVLDQVENNQYGYFCSQTSKLRVTDSEKL